jgi:Na+/H+ antiporter NhaD/arsenite permease-like protein
MQPSAVDHAPELVGGVPFVGVLLSIALFPVLAPRFWQRRIDLVAGFWVVMLLTRQALAHGVGPAAAQAWHAVLLEYLPFITLLLALYTAGGGILLRGGLRGTSAGNTAMLAISMLLAGVMGTIGAAMVLIHPLLHANAHRRRKLHLVVFFIVLVANAGGALTPLGPPLYVGLLSNVAFFWPLRFLGAPLAVLAGVLLSTFYLLDRYFADGEAPPAPRERLRVRGWVNAALVTLIAASVVARGMFDLGYLVLLGQPVAITLLAGMALCLAATVLSIGITPRAVHQGNDFSWHPMAEVAMLFAAIFITISPVLDILHAGLEGPLAPLLRLSEDSDGNPVPMAYFWLSGLLSAFLDNTPTYLVFIRLAGIDGEHLTATQTVALQALSSGSVFFGGLTYIGNAPNLMVRAIASHRGVRMPGFFGFMLLASAALLPALVLISLLFFL